jgi:hypothetical protein
MVRRKRQGNYSPRKNNSIENLVGNEENENSVPDPNRTMINITNELRDIHQKTSQRKHHRRDHGEIHGEATRHG